MPERATELAVGCHLEPEAFLLRHHVANGRVLDARQAGRVQLAGTPALAGRQERWRPQQAADVLGAKRRAMCMSILTRPCEPSARPWRRSVDGLDELCRAPAGRRTVTARRIRASAAPPAPCYARSGRTGRRTSQARVENRLRPDQDTHLVSQSPRGNCGRRLPTPCLVPAS